MTTSRRSVDNCKEKNAFVILLLIDALVNIARDVDESVDKWELKRNSTEEEKIRLHE